jgi:hypothetical protein
MTNPTDTNNNKRGLIVISPDAVQSNKRSRLNNTHNDTVQTDEVVQPSSEDEIPTTPTTIQASTAVLNKTLITKDLLSDDAKVVIKALCAIWALCYNKDNPNEAKKSREAIHQVWGGHTQIVIAMQNHSKSKQLQAEGCRALQNPCYEYDVIKQPIVAVGGIDVILAALKRYPTDPLVQSKGCGALTNLSSKRENINELVEQGTIPTVIGAMKKFRNVARIQQNGCGFIWNVAKQQEHHNRFWESGGISAVGAAVEKFPDDMSLRNYAREAMKLLL